MSFLLKLDWWVYTSVAASSLIVGLLLNYIVKKINEARLEDRLIRLQDKTSSSRYSQAQRQELKSRVMLESILEQSCPPTLTGISQVFNKDEKPPKNRNCTDQIQIMNFPNSDTFAASSASTTNEVKRLMNESRETHNIKQPEYLGVIYKELDVPKAVERNESLSNVNSIFDEILNKIFSKNGESNQVELQKSAVSATKDWK